MKVCGLLFSGLLILNDQPILFLHFLEERKYFEQHFIIAEHFRQAAATAGAQWLKTEDLLIRSRITAGNGDWSTAQQLVHKACLQAVSALQQAEYEAEAWKSRVVN